MTMTHDGATTEQPSRWEPLRLLLLQRRQAAGGGGGEHDNENDVAPHQRRGGPKQLTGGGIAVSTGASNHTTTALGAQGGREEGAVGVVVAAPVVHRLRSGSQRRAREEAGRPQRSPPAGGHSHKRAQAVEGAGTCAGGHYTVPSAAVVDAGLVERLQASNLVARMADTAAAARSPQRAAAAAPPSPRLQRHAVESFCRRGASHLRSKELEGALREERRVEAEWPPGLRLGAEVARLHFSTAAAFDTGTTADPPGYDGLACTATTCHALQTLLEARRLRAAAEALLADPTALRVVGVGAAPEVGATLHVLCGAAGGPEGPPPPP